MAAGRSYPASEVGLGGQPRGATLRPRPGALARRSHPALEARGGARGQGRWPGEATQGAMAVRVQEGLEEPSHVEGQEGQR